MLPAPTILRGPYYSKGIVPTLLSSCQPPPYRYMALRGHPIHMGDSRGTCREYPSPGGGGEARGDSWRLVTSSLE